MSTRNFTLFRDDETDPAAKSRKGILRNFSESCSITSVLKRSCTRLCYRDLPSLRTQFPTWSWRRRQESRDIRWLAWHGCPSNVKRSPSFTSARGGDFSEWHNTNPSAVFSASRGRKNSPRPRFAQPHCRQTKVGHCLSKKKWRKDLFIDLILLTVIVTPF